jgi:hypothetical protein
VVVSQELGAILGKATGLAAEGTGSPAEVAAAALAADMAPAGTSNGQAFFPELSLLTKVSPTARLRGTCAELSTILPQQRHCEGGHGQV